MSRVEVCLLASEFPGSDPADLAGRHARGLAREAGVTVTVALTERRPRDDRPLMLGAARVVPVEEALLGRFDIAVATSWQTCSRLFELDALRHAYLVDHLAHARLQPGDAWRVAAQTSCQLPVDFLAEAGWLAAALAELNPEARCLTVLPGVDKDLFESRAGPTGTGGPLRVLVDDRDLPSSATMSAGQAVEAMTEDHAVGELGADDDPAVRAGKYAAADVLVRLSPVDGVLGSPLEAMHVGVPSVVLPAGGPADLVRHAENGLIAAPDDVRGAGRRLDHLARDRDLLARLSAGARATAESWPSSEAATRSVRAALERLVAEPPPDAAGWPTRLMADLVAAVAVKADFDQQLGAALEQDVAYRLGLKLRAHYRSRRLAPLRRRAAPLVLALRRRLG